MSGQQMIAQWKILKKHKKATFRLIEKYMDKGAYSDFATEFMRTINSVAMIKK